MIICNFLVYRCHINLHIYTFNFGWFKGSHLTGKQSKMTIAQLYLLITRCCNTILNIDEITNYDYYTNIDDN